MKRQIIAALEQLGAHAFPLIALGFVVGLVFQDLAAAAAPLIMPAIFVPLVLSLMRLELEQIRVESRRQLVGAAVIAWTLVGCPLAIAAAGGFLGIPEKLLAPLVIIGCAPPLLAGSALALLIGLNAELTTVLVLAATALSPFTISPLIAVLVGPELEIGAVALASRFLGFVGAAFIAAIVLRRGLGAARIRRSAGLLDAASVLCLLVFIVAIMEGVPAIFRTDARYAISATVAVFALNLALLTASAALFWRTGPRDALSIGLVSANRNIGIMAAVLADRMPPEMLFFIAIGQLPMFLLPSLVVHVFAAAMARLNR